MNKFIQPFALIFALFLQTVALFATGSWYISKMATQVDINLIYIEASKLRIAAVELKQHSLSLNSARFDERLLAFDEQLHSFDAILKRYGESRE